MQNTVLIIGLTVITGLAVGYYLKAKKTANELKAYQSVREREKTETKEEEGTATAP